MLLNLKMKQEQNLSEHVSSFGSILQQLAPLKAIVGEDDQLADFSPALRRF